MRKPFTGRHMTGILVAFFGVVIAVNVLMARFAVSTFGGTVVDNSYVASQDFNRWIREGKTQQAQGWQASLGRAGSRLEVAVTQNRTPVTRGVLSGTAVHPLGRIPDMPLSFIQVGPGRYRSMQSVPAGRWRVELLLTGVGGQASFVKDIAA